MFNKYLTQATSLMGTVGDLDLSNVNQPWFVVHARTGEDIRVDIGKTTSFQTLTNLDAVDRDRYPRSTDFEATPAGLAVLYLWKGTLVSVEGIYQRHDANERFSARTVHILQQAPPAAEASTVHQQEMAMSSDEQRFYFEYTYWWPNQIQRLADKWLDDLFGERRDYTNADFAALYRTNLNIMGLPTDDGVQEMATLSRLIYGLSSTFLLTGIDRYMLAARAGVAYLRESFRGISADGRYTFWTSAKRRLKYGSQYSMTSQNDDDKNTIPLYEQIYALAGLAQYYRITNDHKVLEDIRRTVQTFRDFFRDETSDKGYYSHLDYVTFNCADPSLGNNASRKNWNSIGDHIPAYLVNLILALEPMPAGREDLTEFVGDCKEMLVEITELICTVFPERSATGELTNSYVRERFHKNWQPDAEWGWQQDRAIVGHNLKIAWNLTRVANYFMTAGDPARAEKCLAVADHIAQTMAMRGLDPLRGGCFDAVERHPQNDMPIEFAWGNTKDFWQQEQGILAYLILHGNSASASNTRNDYLGLAREMMSFWNLYFLDRDRQGVFFRTSESGVPITSGAYGVKAGHSVAGYHSFELNYLAHIYLRSYVPRPIGGHQKFCIYFHPDAASHLQSINALPDFFRPGAVHISAVTVNGRRTEWEPSSRFQVPLSSGDLDQTIVVEFQPGS